MRLVRKLEKLHDRLPGLRFYGCVFLALGVGLHGLLCDWNLPGKNAQGSDTSDHRYIYANRIIGLGAGDGLIFAIHADPELFGRQAGGGDSGLHSPDYASANQHYDVSSALWCGVLLPSMLIAAGISMLTVGFFGSPAKWSRSDPRRHRPVIRPGPPNAAR